jgi:hypothetical protein
MLLGPLGFLALAPLMALRARGFARRALQTGAAVLFAAAVAAIHGAPVPFAAESSPSLGIAGSEHPLAVLEAVWQWLLAMPALGLEALILAAAAALIPLAVRGSDLTIAMCAGALLTATLVAAPNVSAVPLVLSGWAVYVALTLSSRKHPHEATERRTLGTVLKQTRMGFANRLEAAGGPRWLRHQQRFREADAR